MSIVFFTGFPGFLGSELLPLVLERLEGSDAVCLVQSKFADLAQERVAALAAAHPATAGRVRLAEGDVTRPDLGLGAERAALQREVREVFHLAAVYDLSVRREVGLRVNFDGTRNLLDFAAGCRGLDRFHYVSTCYVSGRYPGIFGEEDLAKGQKFNNFYEETKYLAEVEVQERMAQGLPATIYRPAVVVGDSKTGATQKFDGPYFVIQWILRQPPIAFLPLVGDPERARVNLVPSDFVIAAIAHLAGLERSLGRVYQLADPEPLTVSELTDAIGRATGRTILRMSLPLAVAKGAIDYVPFVHRVMKIPSATVDYFVHPTHYTCRNVQEDLAGTGIAVPPVTSYLDRLVAYMRSHPEVRSEAMT
jgi:thioester reductase-like protein